MKILVVEDAPDVAHIIARLLAPLSTGEPIIALTMEQATECLLGERYDLITLDLTMPGWDKSRTLAEIKSILERNDGGILLVITGSMDPTIELQALAAGAHGFISKPAVAFRDTFFDNLLALGKSLVRQPTKYQRNLKLANALVEKLSEVQHTKPAE